jgi:RNA polymerase sigma-70 factor (ECF subfamily)
MIEGRRVVAGEAILSRPATSERSRIEDSDPARRIDGSNADNNGTERIDAERRDKVLAALVEQAVREHSRLVYRIAYAVLRSHHDAEDATQETFLRVLRYRAKLDAVEDPKTWLARIAWRVAVDRARKGGKTCEIAFEDQALSVLEAASSEPHAVEIIQGERTEIVLEKLIAALPAKLREPLVLSTVEEMSPREVAATLGISEAAVRSRVFRARQILKQKLTRR